ncbi:hypothetical protein Agub_g9823, partial [Astrephomene gubernaculifera]
PENRTGSAEEASFMRLALNTLYSYRTFGQATFDIVAAISPAALSECRKFRLPCFNASRYATDARSFKNINWAKVKLARDVLKLGYNVHLSDLDVSYLKPIPLAIQEIFSWSNGAADCSMMQEEWVHQDNPDDAASRRPIYLANTGAVFLRSNDRSVAFLESLLRWESDQNQEQYMATVVAYESWAPCSEEATCLAIRHRGMAAITRHPAQFPHNNCAPEPRYRHCASRRLYVHAVCRASSQDKEGFLRSLHAMFIRDGGNGGGGGGGVEVGQQDNEELAASGLPCPARQQRAWRERFYSAYTSEEQQQVAEEEVVAGGGESSEEKVEGNASAGRKTGMGAAAGDGTTTSKAVTNTAVVQLDAGAAALAAKQMQERQDSKRPPAAAAAASRPVHRRPRKLAAFP